MQEGLLGMTVSEVPHVGPLCPRGKNVRLCPDNIIVFVSY